jgi:crotonobetainyl-CoA:carnitine CoA-transferase CaiB-like acyl-CoA transferase
VKAALQGITVLDVSQQLPGPYATMLLQQLGARVVKVEPPGGDVARVLDVEMYEALNAGKEILEIDLHQAVGQAMLHTLCGESDVFVEGFRPGVVGRLGASYELLSEVREGLVYCSLSGYGQTGPYRRVAGHDVNYLGVGGGVREDEDATRRIGVPMIDLGSGTTAALAILAALRRRDIDGVGAYLDVAMLDVAVVWSNLKPQTWVAAPAYGVFRTSDGSALSLAALEDKFWRNLCDVLGWSDWKTQFGDYSRRVRHADQIAGRLAALIAGMPRAHWLELFNQADVPAAPVHDREEMRSDAQVLERELFMNGGPVQSPLPLQLRNWMKAAT